MSPENIVADVFGLPKAEVTDATSHESVSDWDSMGHVNLIMELESTYGVSFSTEDALQMKDVEAIKQTLTNYGVDL